MIVSLLDLHPTDRDESEGRLEIFEAGTGHGSLTLHLARAIHSANSLAPPISLLESDIPEPASQIKPDDSDTDNGLPSADSTPDTHSLENDEQRKLYQEWLASRRAVIHTLDISSKYSNRARRVVRNFRNGLYYSNIDFHVVTIGNYITTRIEEKAGPFLDHAILDLPDCHTYLELLGNVLKSNGSLLVFCPSITQINECVRVVKDERLPLLLEKVLELGPGGGAGGKEWDVRPVRPRALLKAEAEARAAVAGEKSEVDILESSDATDESVDSDQSQSSGWSMVCRPKVGEMVVGGGFLGLWTKMDKTAF